MHAWIGERSPVSQLIGHEESRVSLVRFRGATERLSLDQLWGTSGAGLRFPRFEVPELLQQTEFVAKRRLEGEHCCPPQQNFHIRKNDVAVDPIRGLSLPNHDVGGEIQGEANTQRGWRSSLRSLGIALCN